MNWKEQGKIDIANDLKREKEELDNRIAKTEASRTRIKELKKQLNCDHSMKLKYSASAVGGYDIAKCTKCGFEHMY